MLVSLDNDNDPTRKTYFKENFKYMVNMTCNQARSHLKKYVKRGALPSIILFDQNRNFWYSDFQNILLKNQSHAHEIFDIIRKRTFQHGLTS